MNPNSRIYKSKQGVDFAGYRTWLDHIRPRKRVVVKARRKFRRLRVGYASGKLTRDDIEPVVMSFLGYMSKCDGWKSANGALRELVLKKGEQS